MLWRTRLPWVEHQTLCREAQGGRMQFVTDLHGLLGWSSLDREYAQFSLYGIPQ